VPEHAEGEAATGELDCLDHLVGLGEAAGDEPFAQLGDALVVVRLTESRSAPDARAASEPGSSRTSCSPKVPRCERWRLAPGRSGRCCSSVPPSATFSVSIWRQMPSSGRSRSCAPRGQRQLEAVALGPRVVGLGMAVGAVAGGIEVGTAADDEAVDRIEDRRADLGRVRDLGQEQGDPPGALDRAGIGSGEQVGIGGPDPQRAGSR
jgi:hypothetical protein